MQNNKSRDRKSKFETDSHIEVEASYGPGLTQHDIEQSGEYPYTRGIYKNMYRSRLWTMRQYSGFATAKETNQRFRYLLAQGQTGLSMAFDLPTQMGYDSDDPLAEGEVGKAGVAIDSLEDMELVFKSIPLEQITTSMTINATASILLAFYIAVARKQGVDLRKISGTIQNDILKEYIARATYIYPPEPSLRLVTDIFEYCKENLPRWNTISISGYHIREAGSDAIQELAFTFSNAIAYVSAACEKGLDVDEFGSRLSFFFACHNNFFEEIAKFRAARRIWAKIMKERFAAKNPKSMMLRFHTQTAGSSLTAQQPENNVVRVTVQALAGILGGTQSLHTNSKDEAFALPAEASVRTALRTQQIIAHETGVADTVDPMGGSYFVESLTTEIENRVWRYLDTIDEMGGAVKAIRSKYFQAEISKNAYEYQNAIERGDKIIVGVNEFIEPENGQLEILKVDPGIRAHQIKRLQLLRKKRDNVKLQSTLTSLKQAADSDKNLMPEILSCAEAHATLSEISDILREVFGTYDPN